MADISSVTLLDGVTYNFKDAAAREDLTGKLDTNLKGSTNGLAELDVNGKVPSTQLPSYVDDVLEYVSIGSFPDTGETGKIYVDTTTNKTYRWGGSSYVEISESLALGETGSTAYRGDRGANAYAHAVTNKGSAFASGFYKVTTNSEGHVTAATSVTTADVEALDFIPCLSFENKSVSISDWSADSTLTDFAYRAAVSCSGVTADMYPIVTFASDDKAAGVLSDISTSYSGGVYIYSREQREMTIPKILFEKRSNV